nr:E3 ubiquitin-protein ligase parkin [Nothobranchius furzeri]
MIVFVRYNLGPGVAVELQEEASVAELKEVVGSRQGVSPEELRVLFAGRELQSSTSLQGCDLPEQSTVHVVHPPLGSSSSQLLLLQDHLSPVREKEQRRLTRLDLSSSRLPATSSGLAVILEANVRGGEGGATGGEEVEKTRGATGGEVDKTRGATGGEEGCADERVQRSEQQAEAQKDVRVCSTFFVYCKSCSSIQPGKLRVRCWVCKETTLTLSRGPSCWDDVLLPGRIHGLCQADGCHGNTAEFYMKCASHPTSEDDTSVTLDLIMMNIRNVPCIACTDITEVVLVFQCAARHVICLDCFCRYCQTRLNERQFVYHSVIGYSLPCAAGCEDSLVKELHHFRILGDEQYGRYQQYGAEECLLTLGGLLCPSPGCGAGLLPPNGIRRVECDRQLGCGFIFCRDCRGPYHEGACQVMPAPPTSRDSSQGFVVAEEASQQGRWDRASLLLIQESTKRCPRCSVPVERNGGCMHMQCSLCRAEWCWLCGVPWNRECMGNHWFG